MAENKLHSYINKHAKKLLPLLFLAPSVSKAQPVDTLEVQKIEIEDSVTGHPEYDPQMKPYVAESYRTLPEMSVRQAIISPRKVYVGYFDQSGDLQVIRTDCRYSAAAPDLITGVFRAECPHYTKEHLAERHVENNVPKGFTTEEYLEYLKSPNNSLGEVIRDYCNFRKKIVHTKNGNKSVVVRAGFFQGGVPVWTACIRAAYCSADKNAQKFASNFIEDTPENLSIRDSVINSIYKDDELISGEEGIKKRLSIRPLLSKIKVSGISSKVGSTTCLSERFCDTLKYYTQKQEFDDEQREFEYKKMSASVKKLQEDYLLAWYLLAAKGNMTAQIIDNHMAHELNKKVRNTATKVTPQQVKEHEFGIYTPPGHMLGYIESNVNGGPYFDGYYRKGKEKFFNGFYMLTEKILKNFMKPFDKNKLLTLDFLKQASLVGVSGAQQTYEKFIEKVNTLQEEEQAEIKKIEQIYIKPATPQDATQKQKIIMPFKIKAR